MSIPGDAFLTHKDSTRQTALARAEQARKDVLAGAPLRHSVHAVGGHTGNIKSVCLTPGGRHLVTGSEDHTARLWDPGNGQCVQVFEGHTGDIGALAVTAHGRRLVTGSHDKSARLWDISNGECLHVFAGHTGWVCCTVFTPDGRYVVTGSFDGTAREWDLASTKIESRRSLSPLMGDGWSRGAAPPFAPGICRAVGASMCSETTITAELLP
jgi:WD40 repeat protein